ncbi:MAG: C40 family peptidase [Bacteroidaceae bacterium]|nr:C40 family peptidase [Bacteroidaceae bacterium]
MPKRILFLLFNLLLTTLLSSCRVGGMMDTDYQALARASVRLGVDIERKDNHALYLEAARWIGTPYRSGGSTRQGTDCSGLTSQIYRKVYNRPLHRSAEEQRTLDCRKKRKGNLREGDLVFFHNGKKKRRASHVGIYLKDGQFIHASTSRGVIVSHLSTPYYRQHWLSGGRVK